ncbi:MAG: ribosome-associated translation inhibitor RaiA [Oscillospiraceae bacterium]|nr:ribosome-associated translation inhibitor RaiA [Oscillospiraceae bacterium]
MKFTFTEKKMDAPQELKAYAEKKVGKLDRYFSSESDASVTFSIERNLQKAEITIRNAAFIVRASEATNDMFASIDSAVASMERQIRKNKTRLEKRLRQGAFAKAEETVAYLAPEADDEEEIRIVRSKRFSVKPMSAEEAVMQMNLLGHDFFVFKNMEDDAFSVVYRRQGGDYGLIEADVED